MLVRQSKDPDSMPQRQKRRMFQKKEELKSDGPKFPGRKVLYDVDTLKGDIFNTIEEQEEALASGKWTVHPRMSLEEWLEFRERDTKKIKKVERKHINWAERLKFRDSNLPTRPSAMRKYLSQMNVDDLIARGKELGIDFGSPGKCPTKAQMRRKIRAAEESE